MDNNLESLSALDNINAMHAEFIDKKNTYEDGSPGAGIESNTNLLLCLKNVPKNIDNNGLRNILQNYGDIVKITTYDKSHGGGTTPLRFATCKDVKSLESVLRNMAINDWNIEVSQKTEKRNTSTNSENSIEFTKPMIKDKVPSSTSLAVLHPVLKMVQHQSYFNKSMERMYFLSNHVTEYTYQLGKTSETNNTNSKGEMMDVRENMQLQSKNKVLLGNCFYCGAIANKNCERCNEFYCSKECQSADWLTHKLVCLDRPTLIPIDQKLIPHDPYMGLRIENERLHIISTNLKVIITHIEQSNLVFVRSIDDKHQNDYVRILNIINSKAVNAPQLSATPKPGDNVLIQYNDEWFRAVVLDSCSSSEILIAYPDIGCTEIRNQSEMRELPLELKGLTRFPWCIYLKGVGDVVLNENAKRYLYSLVDNCVELRIIFSTNLDKCHNVVELIALDSNENVNKKLNALILPVQPGIYETPLVLEDIPVLKIQPSKNVKLIVLDNSFIDSGFISCIPNTHADKLDKLNNLINSYEGGGTRNYTPRENEVCIAKMCHKPETWYRAVCEKVSGDGKPILSLLDYGNIYHVSIENIRKCPKQLGLPSFTNLYHVKGLGETKDKANTLKLQKIIKLYDVLNVPEISLVDGENYIKLPAETIQSIKRENIPFSDDV